MAVTSDLQQPSGSAPVPQRRPPGALRTIASTLRNLWRQLTSMRTALVLLFLLALASLPGALLPQWSLNRATTAQYILDNPTFGPWLDRLGFFEVFASPWYAAIYLLLFTSLIGCVLPRTADFVRQLRMAPVGTPRNLSRLPHFARTEVPGAPADVAARVRQGLPRWRVEERAEGPDGVVTISAEKGYLREVGNLVFHLSLLGLLVAIAVGKLVGYEGSKIVQAGPETPGFCSTSPVSYDNFRPGLTVDGTALSPFCVEVDTFRADYTEAGQAVEFRADIRYQGGDAAGTERWQDYQLRVNEPLRLDGERLYLLGHGYTPQFEVTFPDGTVRRYEAPFQPMDSMFTSQGAVKVLDPPGATGDEIRDRQLGIVGIFAPTAVVRDGIMTSDFPALRGPGVAIDVYRGDLGLESGRAQSVFALDMDQVEIGALVKQARANLLPGESVVLDDGTRVTFTGATEWVSLQTSYDPAQVWALVCAVLLLLGLMISLVVKRRRVWFKITPVSVDGAGPTGDHRGSGMRSVVEVGGLARTDQAGYGEEFGGLAALPAQDGSGKPGRADRNAAQKASTTW